MFTGIIEELGEINGIEKRAGGAKMAISARTVTDGSKDGDSIAVNGVCLTAVCVTEDLFFADVSAETLRRSTLGALKPGSKVNLERAATPDTRLGGHFVLGHVDARGRFSKAVRDGDFWTVSFSYPQEIGRYLVYKGSISVEGISLTIAGLTDDQFEVAIIPKTWDLTNLSTLREHDEVNLEADVIAKYVERMMTYRDKIEDADPLTMEKLVELGFG